MDENDPLKVGFEVLKKDVNLPARPFLYTIDQISTLTSIHELDVRKKYLYFEGRSIGLRKPTQMSARNIAASTDKPDWRVAERELLQWLKRQGFKVYQGSYARR